MKRTVLAAAAFVALAAPAARAETPEQIIKLTDAAQTSYKDLSMESSMTIYEPNGSKREIAFVTISKGEKRLVRFTAPGDIKGMGFLAESRDVMYAYLPGFNRVRRLGTHVKGQSFMGSDVAYEDMSANTFGGAFSAKLTGEEAGMWVLELNLLPGKEAEFPKLKIWVDKKAPNQTTKIEYYDDKGAKQRTQIRGDFKKDEGPGEHWTPGIITFIDHRRNDHKTEIRNAKNKVNTGVSDDQISQRALVRGQ